MDAISKKRILIHSNYRPDNYGGIEFVVKSIIGSLPDSLYIIRCFFGGDRSSVDFDGRLVSYVCRKILFKIGGASILSFGNISFFINGLKSDLIIYQEPYPTLWPSVFLLRRIFRKKVIVLIHANPTSNFMVMRVYRKIRDTTFSGSVCISTSPNLLRKVDSSSFKYSKVVPLAVPIFHPITSFNLDLPNRFVLYIGRLAGYKGLEYLIDCISKCPEVNFVIAGDGPMASEISSKISILQLLNVKFINRFVSESEKNELIYRCDFLLFPSTSENEAFGLVQLEAMCLGKPIVNTILDSGVNYVAPNFVCAISVDRCNADLLAEATMKLWYNPDMIGQLGGAGYLRYLENFTEEKFCDAWLSLVESQFDIKPFN